MIHMVPEHLTFFLFYGEIENKPLPAPHKLKLRDCCLPVSTISGNPPWFETPHVNSYLVVEPPIKNILSYVKLHRVPEGQKKKH